jgi:transcriptional regulator with XRE-family HTH domain
VNIAASITTARVHRGLSRRALAKACGVHLAQVSRWELGETMPHASILPVLCGVLGIGYVDLLGPPAAS